MFSILTLMDFLGTVAFAVSGAMVGIRQRMDLFGVVVLAMVTATGGGVLRDIIIGSLPPASFQNPVYILIATLTGLVLFGYLYMNLHPSRRASHISDLLMFSFDTLGIAAFTVDGIIIGMDHGFSENGFLLVFLGVITGVGGGIIRDMLAIRMPDVLVKHVYALAALLGGLLIIFLIRSGLNEQFSMVTGFLFIVILRIMAAYFRWNLPRIADPDEK